jgi:hypothetical protein
MLLEAVEPIAKASRRRLAKEESRELDLEVVLGPADFQTFLGELL